MDENIPVPLKGFIIGHSVASVRDMNWLGTKNGKLIALAEAAFDCLLTLDQGMQHQNDLRSKKMGFLVVRAKSNRMGDLTPLIPDILRGLNAVGPGKVTIVP